MAIPVDSIIKILTAATPIVASIASMSKKEEPTTKSEKPADNNKPNVTIHNHFHLNSTNQNRDEVMAKCPNLNRQQIVDALSSSDSNYII